MSTRFGPCVSTGVRLQRNLKDEKLHDIKIFPKNHKHDENNSIVMSLFTDNIIIYLGCYLLSFFHFSTLVRFFM